MSKASTFYLQDKDKPADHVDVDLVAAGYEATCPECEELCELIEVPRDDEAVVCHKCGANFTTGLPEHAYH